MVSNAVRLESLDTLHDGIVSGMFTNAGSVLEVEDPPTSTFLSHKGTDSILYSWPLHQAPEGSNFQGELTRWAPAYHYFFTDCAHAREYRIQGNSWNCKTGERFRANMEKAFLEAPWADMRVEFSPYQRDWGRELIWEMVTVKNTFAGPKINATQKTGIPYIDEATGPAVSFKIPDGKGIMVAPRYEPGKDFHDLKHYHMNASPNDKLFFWKEVGEVVLRLLQVSNLFTDDGDWERVFISTIPEFTYAHLVIHQTPKYTLTDIKDRAAIVGS